MVEFRDKYHWSYDKFFDPLSFYIPKNLKEIFKFARYFYETNHLVSTVVYKMAEYPITSLIYDTEDPELKKEYEEILEDKIDIKRLLIEIGLDYFVYGNAFVTLLTPFKRMFLCPKCNTPLEPKIDEHGRRNWRVVNGQIHMECPKHHDVPVRVVDDPIRTNDFVLARWDPMRITIDFSELTQKTKVYYNLPKEEMRKIHTDPDFLKNVRKPFLDAILKGKSSVLFDDDKIFIFKRPSISHEFKGWGLPPILHVMQALFYLQMLRRAQFAIAEDRLLNFRYLYPPAEYVIQGSPFATNLNMWKNHVEEALRIWRENPNHMPIFPVPVAYGTLSGEGKTLMVFPEIEEIIKEIITGMQVPQELVFGGLTWSGSSVSLRMLENQYLNYRRYLVKLLDYIVKTIAKVKDIPAIKIRLRAFRMADDVQRAQLKLQLSNMGKISDRTLLDEFELDFENELAKKYQEAQMHTQYQLALENYQQQLKEQPETVVDMRPLPEQKPPRRQGGI